MFDLPVPAGIERAVLGFDSGCLWRELVAQEDHQQQRRVIRGSGRA